VELSKKYHKDFGGIAPEAEILLKNHTWKGNIRELKNIIERCVLIEDGPILHLNDLGLATKDRRKTAPSAPDAGVLQTLPDEGVDLAALEKHLIMEALKKAGGNSRRAADLLKMNYYTFRYKRKNIEGLQ